MVEWVLLEGLDLVSMAGLLRLPLGDLVVLFAILWLARGLLRGFIALKMWDEAEKSDWTFGAAVCFLCAR